MVVVAMLRPHSSASSGPRHRVSLYVGTMVTRARRGWEKIATAHARTYTSLGLPFLSVRYIVLVFV